MTTTLVKPRSTGPLTLPDPPRSQVNMRLGDVLIQDGNLSPAQLASVLEEQKGYDAPLGEIIEARGLLRQEEVTHALARVYSTSTVDLARDPPDPRLKHLLRAEDCLHHKALVWRRAGGVTVLASSDPRGAKVLLRRIPKDMRPARIALSHDAALHRSISTLYGSKLSQIAEQRAPEAQSCRSWSGLRMALALALAMATFFIASPVPLSAALLWLAVSVLIVNTCLKLTCLAAALRPLHPRKLSPPRDLVLPKISILVPLFKEENIATALVERLSRLDYPPALLEIFLITEADDTVTQKMLAQAKLPKGMRAVTVPRGTLKTKPRAMNYALDFTSGSIIGVYDAEDAPEPDQLRRVAEGFARGETKLACLQGILGFYNPRAGWLARCFSFEYAGWFRVMLPGLQRLHFAIPLGGTTLFFRRDALIELGGWDAHNVTEDADLGMRLARFGYRCEMLDTVTYEEANNRLWPWVKQRSRWLKGYAMTWCVHMRNPFRLWRDLGTWKFLGFQLLFLGTLMAFCLAPVLWWGFAHFLSFGAIPPPAGLTENQTSALTVLFLACEGVTLGLFLVAGKKLHTRPSLIWVFTLPAYFMLATLAAYKGVFEMIRKPFFWDKTEHGISPSDGTLEVSGSIDFEPGLKSDGKVAAQRLTGASSVAVLQGLNDSHVLGQRNLAAPVDSQ